ncbi:hypothetical protein Bsph_p112 (plasmid) [Lysinibacillus sphaericus C3-41]|uniref:Uncharacterized protein n=1 Tax=Lysinibacillus sphaericus (strain C3-41) TaxID=444177 RepID=B1I0I3_LYSSC|nr:hypothetical protein Bsph_p112 [Lysinibacillus sphaericus C3-41]
MVDKKVVYTQCMLPFYFEMKKIYKTIRKVLEYKIFLAIMSQIY